MDAERSKLGVKRLGKRFDGELGGAVDTPAGKHGAVAADGGHIDNVAGALLAERGQDGARDIEQAEDVGAVEILDFLRGSFLDSAEQTITGVVHKNIDAAKMLEGRVDRRLDLRLVGDIQSNAKKAFVGA